MSFFMMRFQSYAFFNIVSRPGTKESGSVVCPAKCSRALVSSAIMVLANSRIRLATPSAFTWSSMNEKFWDLHAAHCFCKADDFEAKTPEETEIGHEPTHVNHLQILPLVTITVFCGGSRMKRSKYVVIHMLGDDREQHEENIVLGSCKFVVLISRCNLRSCRKTCERLYPSLQTGI